MNKEVIKKVKRYRRKAKIRSNIKGTKETPRLSVFRSNQGVFLQLIDDENGKTLASANSQEIDSKKIKAATKEKDSLGSKEQIAYEVGKLIAQKAKDKNIKRAVFDRGGFRYHGRVKAVGEGARDGGLEI